MMNINKEWRKTMKDYKKTLMYQEILETPDILKTLKDENEETLLKIKEEFQKRHIQFILGAGRGTSANALNFFRYLIGVKMGIIMDIASPSILTTYHADMNYGNTLVLAVSQSGEAKDAMEIIKDARKKGALTISVTNFQNSSLAEATQYHLFLNCKEEKALEATKTFSAELYLLSLLVYTLSDDNEAIDKLSLVSDYLTKYLDEMEKISDSLSQEMVKIDDGFVLGRGLLLPIAEETRTKLSEAAYLRIQSYSTAEFYHGPLALIDNGTFILYLASKTGPKGSDDVYRFEEHQKNIEKYLSLNASLHVLTDDKRLKADNTTFYYIDLSISEEYLIFIFTMIIQLSTVKTSIKKGLDVDSPRSLHKVTFTK